MLFTDRKKEMPDKKENRTWYYLIDAFRGFALINMLLFHFCYDVFVIFRQSPGWYYRPLNHAWQQFICISFLAISGISWHFGRHNVRRGILLNFCGLIITAVTLVFLPSEAVWFGILNCIGCCTLLLFPINKLHTVLTRKSAVSGFILSGIGLLVSVFLFFLTRDTALGYLNFFGTRISVPEIFYVPKFMTVFGFPFSGFRSSDYFPLFPWLFIFLAGYYFWALVKPLPRIQKIFTYKVPLLSCAGRNTLWVYMIHQPLLYAAAYFFTEVLGISF